MTSSKQCCLQDWDSATAKSCIYQRSKSSAYLLIDWLCGFAAKDSCRESHGFHDSHWGERQPVSHISNCIYVVHAGLRVLIHHNGISLVHFHTRSLHPRPNTSLLIVCEHYETAKRAKEGLHSAVCLDAPAFAKCNSY